MHVRFHDAEGNYVLVEATRLKDGTVKLHSVRESHRKANKMPPVRKVGRNEVRLYTPDDYAGLKADQQMARKNKVIDCLIDFEQTITRYPEAVIMIKTAFQSPQYQLSYKLSPSDVWVNITRPTLQQAFEEYFDSVQGGTV